MDQTDPPIEPPQDAVAQARVNREAWLTGFMSLALPVIKLRTGLTLSRPVKVSCGYPSSGGRPRGKSKSITAGECHVLPPTSERHYHQIFVHPFHTKPIAVGGIVMHELLHAMLPYGAGHRKPFSQAAKRLGLDGKPTHATIKEGSELAMLVEEMAMQLGDYPHESLALGDGPVQTTRLIKVACPICGYVARVTYKWIDEAGCPVCPQDLIPMEEAGVDFEATSPLVSVEQTVEYKVKAVKRFLADRTQWDDRFMIRMHRKGNVLNWWVVDYGEQIEDGKWVLGDTYPHLSHADNRSDAIALLEGLREGSVTYDDIDERDHHEEEFESEDLGEVDDWDDDEEFLDDEEDDVDDNPAESDTDPRFEWEKRKGIPAEAIDPEDERRKREGWVN